MAITAKQEAFALKWFETKTAADAYRAVYSVKNMARASIQDAASKLARNPVVVQRIQELKEQSASKILIDREYITQGIIKNIAGAESCGERGVALKGYEMLSKMYDLNEDRQNDRLVSPKERAALVENFRARMLDVTE